MGRNTRKRRSPLAVRAVAASAALAVAGGGLVWANFYASAGEPHADRAGTRAAAAAQVATIDCPDVGQQLRDVPDGARAGVDKELALLDEQITEAYARLASTRDAQAGDAGYVQNAILGPLRSKRTATIDRIAINIKRVGGAAPGGIDRLAGCAGKTVGQPDADESQGDGQDQGQDQGQDDGQNGDGQDGGQDTGQDGGQGQAGDNGNGAAGPFADDFADITTVQPNVRKTRTRRGGSSGTFTSVCGVNENKLFNTDNLIVAPGVDNGAHHTHDYVGNQGNDAFASDDDLANADTTCQNQGDRSTYYWPVIRVQDGTAEFDANEQGGGAEGNVGRIVQAESAEIKFVGNPRSKVVAMPRFLRIITGDAKAFTNGTANANSGWTCTGFTDRVLTDKYPLCPDGSKVVRTFDFQSCWDGQNIDSANHRDHVAFADPDTGACPQGFQAIPQLTMNLVYDVPRPTIENGQVRQPFAVDGFPEQLHKPITDHDDFINVFDEDLMNQMVKCINSGRKCT
ncbi:hypothetical protein GCM10010145_37700 [Streptomyces ruber]|uniref:DUF1996 domain-containing protein n=2 Tax=Streptomyces TaxID=1883 RepID=A0A918ET62_9ACTN|nr:DUF1996 domain-containing protein [Streptomyces ruber]GGQ64312.1 hypothetical protein GCM10010145_37700 [Streptomyces ruber]